MKVEFIDVSFVSDDEKVVMELDIIPKVGESVYFSPSLLKDNYLGMMEDDTYVIANKCAGNKYKTIEATVDKVSHIYKETGNIVQIKITFVECNEIDRENNDDED